MNLCVFRALFFVVYTLLNNNVFIVNKKYYSTGNINVCKINILTSVSRFSLKYEA